MRATLKRTLLFGSKLGTILVVMALGVGVGLGFSTLAHPPEAGDFDAIHACVNDTTGQVLMPQGIQPTIDTPCPAGWSPAHWPARVRVSIGTVSAVFDVPDGIVVTQDLACSDSDDRVISGGVSTNLLVDRDFLIMHESFPSTLNTWRVTVESTDIDPNDDPVQGVLHILCAPNT